MGVIETKTVKSRVKGKENLAKILANLAAARKADDLEGADALLPQMQADTLLADKAFDADERVIEPLLAAGKKLVIPPKSNRLRLRPTA